MILFLTLLAALIIWAVAATLAAVRTDGFGEAESARRNRSPEPFPRER